jgi:hypothetical protein
MVLREEQMPLPKGLLRVVLLLGASAWGALPSGVARAGQEPAAVSPVARPCSLEQLARMSWQELECLYRQSPPGTIPDGYARGRPLYDPQAPLTATRSRVTRLLWHGKHFCAADGTLVNQWCGFKAIRAEVGYGPSWLDGAPSIVMDYGHTSRVWADVRDELREVAPGLYLGAMYQRRDGGAKFKMFFALDCLPAGAGRPGPAGEGACR